MFKKILFWLLSFFCLGWTRASPLLDFETLSLTSPNSGNTVFQFTTPSFTLIIRNIGTSSAMATNPIPVWFITCTVNNIPVYQSDPIEYILINPGSSLQFPIIPSNTATSSVWLQTMTCTIGNNIGETLNNTKLIEYDVQERQGGRFDTILDTVREPLQNKIDGPVIETGKEWIRAWIFLLIDRFAIRAAIIVWVLFALLALFKMMFSSEEDGFKNIKGLLIQWVVGIIIIVSAKFIGNIFYNDIMGAGSLTEFNTVEMVANLYDLIMWPLIKIWFYIMMGVLFVILLIRVFSFVTSDAEEVQKKSANIIINTTVGLLMMLWSKQLVEGVYGKEDQIRNDAAVTISEIGWSFLSTANIPIIYQIIQRVMGLSAFVILALIIFQTYKMLINPTDEENLTSIRKTLLYALLGILVIGAGYLIVNVLMVN